MEEKTKKTYNKLYENAKKAIQIFGTKEDKKILQSIEEQYKKEE